MRSIIILRLASNQYNNGVRCSEFIAEYRMYNKVYSDSKVNYQILLIEYNKI